MALGRIGWMDKERGEVRSGIEMGGSRGWVPVWKCSGCIERQGMCVRDKQITVLKGLKISKQKLSPTEHNWKISEQYYKIL